jgi:hypothetical protein
MQRNVGGKEECTPTVRHGAAAGGRSHRLHDHFERHFESTKGLIGNSIQVFALALWTRGQIISHLRRLSINQKPFISLRSNGLLRPRGPTPTLTSMRYFILEACLSAVRVLRPPILSALIRLHTQALLEEQKKPPLGRLLPGFPDSFTGATNSYISVFVVWQSIERTREQFARCNSPDSLAQVHVASTYTAGLAPIGFFFQVPRRSRPCRRRACRP